MSSKRAGKGAVRRRRAKRKGGVDRAFDLDNGMRVLLVQRSGMPVVASTIWYRVGSRDEQTGQTGCSHLLEHMMFKGTDRYAKGEIDVLTSRMGGSNNAFTDHDTTAYWFALAADRWEVALEIERSRMQGCLLDPTEFVAEKSVVLEELAMYDDDPWNRIWQAGESLAYQVHPYHHPIIGWKEDVERLSVEELWAYYEAHYGPDRAFMVVVGAIDLDRTEGRIRELFEGLNPAEERRDVLVEPEPRGARMAHVVTPGSTVRLAIGFPSCRVAEDDDFTLDVLRHVLAAEGSSRLYKDLVLDNELATSVHISNEARRDPGLFWVLVELRPGAEPAAVEGRVHDAIERIARRGVRSKELQRAKALLTSSWIFEEETVLDVAQRLGRFESVAAGGYAAADNVLQSYEAVDDDRVRDVVRRYLTPERRTVVVGDPEDGPRRLRARGEAR